MKNENVFCTIFTPTYNRLNTIKRLFDSLCIQTDYDFEWVIIDDGSTDKTQDFLLSLDNQLFPITYIKTENGGKHRAINKGLDYAKGKVFAIVDSDDYLAENAVETIKRCFANIDCFALEKKYAGIGCLKCYQNGEIIGTTFQGEYCDAKSTDRQNYNINGDKFEVFYTNVLRKNKFPEFENEKFVTEAVVWFRLSRQGYIIRWFNEPVYYCEYLGNGLTNNLQDIFINNPKGFSLYIKEQEENNELSIRSRFAYYDEYYQCRRIKNIPIEIIAKELNTTRLQIIMAVIERKIVKIIKRK